MSERELLLKEVAELPDYQVLYLLGIIRGLMQKFRMRRQLNLFVK